MSDKNYAVNGVNLTRAYDSGEDVFEVPNGVKTIGEGAFRETNFKRVILPKSVTKIEADTFRECKNLEEINLQYIYEFGDGAFRSCGIKSVEVHAPVISDMLFRDCAALSKVELVGTREIGESAFELTGALTEIALPETLVKIGAFAFITSGVRRVHLPRKVASIGAGAFAGCSPIYVYSKTSAENYWGAAIHIKKAVVSILNENDGSHEDFFFYPEIFQKIKVCFENEKFDISKYDETIFYSRTADPIEIRKLVYAMILRLPGIYKLHYPEFRKYYAAFVNFFNAHKPLSAVALLDLDKNKFLGSLELCVDEKTFLELLNYAIEKGDPEITAAILKYKSEHFPNLNDNFDLK